MLEFASITATSETQSVTRVVQRRRYALVEMPSSAAGRAAGLSGREVSWVDIGLLGSRCVVSVRDVSNVPAERFPATSEERHWTCGRRQMTSRRQLQRPD
jgi:hypothetical protein